MPTAESRMIRCRTGIVRLLPEVVIFEGGVRKKKASHLLSSMLLSSFHIAYKTIVLTLIGMMKAAAAKIAVAAFSFRRGSKIRTYDPLLPKQVR